MRADTETHSESEAKLWKLHRRGGGCIIGPREVGDTQRTRCTESIKQGSYEFPETEATIMVPTWECA